MNTAFNYMYRDGGNNKSYGTVVLAGEITEAQKERFAKALNEGEYFIASQVDVPEVFLWDPEADYDPDDPSTYPEELGAGKYFIWDDMDHSWHEFMDFDTTQAEPTDPRTIEQFVQAFERAKKAGWKEFEPRSRRVRAEV